MRTRVCTCLSWRQGVPLDPAPDGAQWTECARGECLEALCWQHGWRATPAAQEGPTRRTLSPLGGGPHATIVQRTHHTEVRRETGQRLRDRDAVRETDRQVSRGGKRDRM